MISLNQSMRECSTLSTKGISVKGYGWIIPTPVTRIMKKISIHSKIIWISFRWHIRYMEFLTCWFLIKGWYEASVLAPIPSTKVTWDHVHNGSQSTGKYWCSQTEKRLWMRSFVFCTTISKDRLGTIFGQFPILK